MTKKFTFDYSQYAPELVPLDLLQKALKIIIESNFISVLDKVGLGWIGAIITLVACAIYYWLYWKTIDIKQMIERQKFEEMNNQNQQEQVNPVNPPPF